MKEIRVKDLYFSYDDEFVFERISFTLKEGDGCTLLAGRNGAGKSTLLNVLCGVLEQDGGSIEREGLHIAYLPFESPLYPHLTILENLRYFYRSFQGKDFDVEDVYVKEVVEALSIDYLKQRFDKCSSGQQQKAGIACILLSGADLIIMDEPFIAIDSKSAQALIAHIQKRKQDTIFLITTHTANALIKSADQLLYLRDKGLSITKDTEQIQRYFEEESYHDAT